MPRKLVIVMLRNLILGIGLNPLRWQSVRLHNLDQRQKVSKGEVLTLRRGGGGGGGPDVCPRPVGYIDWRRTHDSSAQIPCEPLKRVLAREKLRSRGENSGVLCPRAESEADFYSPPVTPGQRAPPP